MGIRTRLCEERAQATVEMAVVTPVLLVLALIVYNVMVFADAVARFDRVVPDIVLAHAVAPSGEGDDSSIDASATVQAQIQHAMEGYDLQIEVSSEQGATTSDGGLLSLSGTFRTYTCTMRYEPWPSSLSVAGVSLGAPAKLSHERAVTVDPWRPGGGYVTAAHPTLLRAGAQQAGLGACRVCGGGVVCRAPARHAGTVSDCRQRVAARHGVPTLLFGPHLLYGLPHRHCFYRPQRQHPRMLRKRPSLAHVFLSRCLGGAGTPFNPRYTSRLSTSAGVRIGDSGLSSYEIG